MKIKNFILTGIFSILITGCQKNEVLPPEPVLPIPNEYQLAWHKLEQYAFIHFTTNTFTDKEWGYGDENPKIFNPTELNAEQWVTTIKETGLKGLIITTKHHDGFCLWPSKYTEHSLKQSPYKNGNGDIVKEVADACRKHGLLFGAYLSPWDRNFAGYAKPEYITYYRNQLTELIENYGPFFEIWFDGANGGDGYYGGSREIRKIDNSTYYDWPNTISIARKLNPEAILFSDAGPDIRWCGNERGVAGETNWNTISIDTLHPGKAGISPLLNKGSEDGNAWVPAEVDVSIRPGWFYHAKEDTSVRTAENLFKIYLESVGRGSNLLLNLPPDRRGLIHENDVKTLREWKKLIDKAFANNIAPLADVKANTYRGKSHQFSAANVTDSNDETYWATDDNILSGNIEMDFKQPRKINYVVLQEYIALGQRVKSFDIEILKNDKWEKVAFGTTIGYKRILPLENIETTKLKINILDSKACPTISNIEIF
jgi:alpha-L-fucosidase